jgi:hypothetical protein
VVQEHTTATASTTRMVVETCDCLGECGYGPNIMMWTIDNNNDDATTTTGTQQQLINQVRGRDAIYQVLGIADPVTTSDNNNNETESMSNT